MQTTDKKVLDDIGFVRLVDHMGGDNAVVQAARVSYGKGLKGEEADKKLIGFLLSNRHTTPFEHTSFKFHVKAPIFVARQWFRHRMASYNEISGRYTEMKDEFYIPETFRAQSKTNKQGSVEGDLNHLWCSNKLKKSCEEAYVVYEGLIKSGVAKEMARMVLPVNIYTEWYWTLNAHALMHFIRLRSDGHAQWEMRQYSDTIFHMWEKVMPWTAEAFVKTLDLKKYEAIGKAYEPA